MKFNIATDQGILQVEGEPITLMGHKCFVWIDIDAHLFEILVNPVYCVTELKSGMNAGIAFSWDEAVSFARNLFISTTHLEMDKSNRHKLRNADILTYPINS